MTPEFSFHRGALALDFAGTVGRRGGASPDERLPDPAALGRWLRAAGLVDDDAPAGDADLAAAVALREAIARAAGALIDGGHPAAADVAAINGAAGAAVPVPVLDPRTLATRWCSPEPVRAALARVAADAIALLAERRGRLVRCELPGCGGLLLGNERGPRRRWCSMERCGNVAKVAAHRARARAQRAERRGGAAAR